MVRALGPMGCVMNAVRNSIMWIALYMQRMYKKSFEEGSLPPTLNEAIIALIPKKAKDIEQVGLYRRVSLLNRVSWLQY